jgi:hypothetical protein
MIMNGQLNLKRERQYIDIDFFLLKNKNLWREIKCVKFNWALSWLAQ